MKSVTNISKTTLQYTSCISWRMPGSAVQNGSLPITFNGSSHYYFAAIFMPQCDDTGHHHIQWNWPQNNWSVTIDLANISKLT